MNILEYAPQYCQSMEAPFPGAGISGPYDGLGGSIIGEDLQALLDDTTTARDSLLAQICKDERTLVSLTRRIQTFLHSPTSQERVVRLTGKAKLEYSDLMHALETAKYPSSDPRSIAINTAFENCIIPRMVLLEKQPNKTYLIHLKLTGPPEIKYSQNIFSLRCLLSKVVEHVLAQQYPLNKFQVYSTQNTPFWHPTVDDLWSYDQTEPGLYAAISAQSNKQAVRIAKTMMYLFKIYTQPTGSIATDSFAVDTITGIQWVNVAGAVMRASSETGHVQLKTLQESVARATNTKNASVTITPAA